MVLPLVSNEQAIASCTIRITDVKYMKIPHDGLFVRESKNKTKKLLNKRWNDGFRMLALNYDKVNQCRKYYIWALIMLYL